MVNFYCALILLCTVINIKSDNFRQIDELLKQWAPLIWLAPEEKYFPSHVENFFKNVHLTNENGKSISPSQYNNFTKSDSSFLYLVTNNNLENLLFENDSFLNGKNPKEYSVPIYATVTFCNNNNNNPYQPVRSSNLNNLQNDINVVLNGNVEQNLFFHVTYWNFYPYNKGKEICFIGKVPAVLVFGRCFGHLKLMGNHVGDWERITLSFKGKRYPSELYLSTHSIGSYYKYDYKRQIFKFDHHQTKTRIAQMPKFPSIVRMQGGHPVLFSANGSHGLWASPGEHEYNRIPRLLDKCGYGVPWKTWNNVQILKLGISEMPNWINYKGKWGNPKTNCILFKKLGLCEHTDGPPGILRANEDFFC